MSVTSVDRLAHDRRVRYVRGVAILLAVALVGLFWAKWQPYLARTLMLMSTHAYPGSSIIGDPGAPVAPSIGAAVDYARAYFLAVWQAMLVGLVLSATIQTVVPHDWIARSLGKTPRAAVFGGLLSLPTMMCTCCTAPVVVGLRKSGAAAGTSMAFFLGNPTLNPAVLIFLALTMGWEWALLRAGFGLALVVGAATIAARLTSGPSAIPQQPAVNAALPSESGSVVKRWIRSFSRLLISLVPEYVAIVLLLGAARAFLFPAAAVGAGDGPLLPILFAISGTLFVIPTAAEIPIIQSLQAFGASPVVAGVLLLTLAPVSLPSLLMLARWFEWRILVAVTALTVLVGVLAGVTAQALGL